MTYPTDAGLDGLAQRAGGYIAAAFTEYDIAQQYEGLGNRECDELAAYHRTVAIRLHERCATVHQGRMTA